MNVGILTHYQVESHGARLQLYAMSSILKELGHNPFVLTYTKSFDFASEYNANKFNVSLKNIPWYLKEYLIKKGPGILINAASKHRVLTRFNDEHFTYKRFSDADLDVAIVGADEVFSLDFGVNYPMFGHGVDAKRMVAYAPSFGQTDLAKVDHWHCRTLMESGLKNFSALSARDDSTRKMLKKLTGRNVPIVCDPALLYSFEKEMSDFSKGNEGKFIALYGYNTNLNEDWQIQQIRNYADRHSYKVYSIGGYHRWCDKQIVCDPLEMIHWFKRATCVVTDTFHGTIASVIARSPVAVYVRDTNNVKLDYLLHQLGLESRKASRDRTVCDVFSEKQDFETVEAEVRQLREAGLKYLMGALEENNE